MKGKAKLLTVLLALSLAPVAFSQSANQLLAEAKSAQAAGKKDVAFMLYRQILRQYPESEQAVESQFLIGQYYYDSRNYFDASETFRAFLRKYPQSRFSKDAKEYLGKMELGSLKDRADRLFAEGKLGPAAALYEQYLGIDPDNAQVKAQLERISRIRQEVHLDFEQLNRERKKLQQEKDALDRQLAELENREKEVLRLHKEAAELNRVTVEKYEKRLAAVAGEVKGSKKRISELESQLKQWRQRAIIVEAARLSQPLPKGLALAPGEENLPRIAFDGGKPDPAPQEGEVQLSDILREGFPAVVITEAKLDVRKNLRHVQAILCVDLSDPWPDGAKLKLRVDLFGKAGQPAPDPQFLVRYYLASDMDEIDEETQSYRKRVVFTIEENKVERYEVRAFLVKGK